MQLAKSCTQVLIVASFTWCSSFSAGAQECDQPINAGDSARKLGMSRAIACVEIRGYEDYDVLEGASLTSEEKLLVYYRPERYATLLKGNEYVAHFTQDGQIRRKGAKTVLRRKRNLLDYEAKANAPPELIYLRNTFSLKGLSPGEYEYDIILRDENRAGSTALQSLDFRVVAPTSK